MTRNNLLISILLIWLLFAVPMTLAQDTPTPESQPITATETVPAATSESTMLYVIIIAGMIMFTIVMLGDRALVGYLSKRLGDSIPADKIQMGIDSAKNLIYEKVLEAAERTPEEWDEDAVRKFATLLGYRPPTTGPIKPSPGVPSIPPTIPAPQPLPSDTTLGLTRYKVTFENFDPTKTVDLVVDGNSRRVYTPQNMEKVFSNQNVSGKEYPYPSVNIKPEHGIRFDIASIAGTWGYSVDVALVNGINYTVSINYKAQITGNQLSNLSDWLWWCLELDGIRQAVNHGINNGEHTASWRITGTGKPMTITPRIHAQWASAGDTSAIEWHSLVVEPIG